MKMIKTANLKPALLALSALAMSSGVMADQTWTVSGTCGYADNTCGTPTSMTIGAFDSNATNTKFNAALLSNSTTYLGVNSKDTYGTARETTTSPHHAIDSYKYYTSTTSPTSGTDNSTSDTSGGADYAEMIYLKFTDVLALTSVAANWTYSTTAGTGEYSIYAFTGSNFTSVADYTADQLKSGSAGWTLVSSKDFATGYNKSVQTIPTSGPDTSVYSSHWLITTKFDGGNNDSFKLASFSAAACAHTVTGGTCAPDTPGLPEPGSLALMAVGFLALARRRVTGVVRA